MFHTFCCLHSVQAFLPRFTDGEGLLSIHVSTGYAFGQANLAFVSLYIAITTYVRSPDAISRDASCMRTRAL